MYSFPCIVEEFSHTLINFFYFVEGLIIVMCFFSQLTCLFLIKKGSSFFDTENKVTFLNILYCSLILHWIVWWEKDVKIFEEKWRMVEILWDLLHFYPLFGPRVPTSLKAFYSMLFSLVGIRFVSQKGWITTRGA